MLKPRGRGFGYRTAKATEITASEIATHSPSDKSDITIKDATLMSRGWRARFLSGRPGSQSLGKSSSFMPNPSSIRIRQLGLSKCAIYRNFRK
jgi:hypothetical protein